MYEGCIILCIRDAAHTSSVDTNVMSSNLTVCHDIAISYIICHRLTIISMCLLNYCNLIFVKYIFLETLTLRVPHHAVTINVFQRLLNSEKFSQYGACM